MEVIRAFWLSDWLSWIVKAKDKTTGEIKFYIGTGKWDNEEEDIQHILRLWSKIEKQYLLDFLND